MLPPSKYPNFQAIVWHYFAYWNMVFSVWRPHTKIFTQIRFIQFPLATTPHRSPVGWTPQGFMLDITTFDNLSPCCTKTPWATVRYMHHHSSSLDLGSWESRGRWQLPTWSSCWCFCSMHPDLLQANIVIIEHMKSHCMCIYIYIPRSLHAHYSVQF